VVTLTQNLAASTNLVKRDSGFDLPCPFLQQEESLVRKTMLLTAQKPYSPDWQILYESHNDVRIALRLLGGASEQARRSFDVVRRGVNETNADYPVNVELDGFWVWKSCCVGKMHAVFSGALLGACLL